MVLVLFVSFCGLVGAFFLFVVLLFYLLDPVWNCEHLVGEEGAHCFAFHLFVAIVLTWHVALGLGVFC